MVDEENKGERRSQTAEEKKEGKKREKKKKKGKKRKRRCSGNLRKNQARKLRNLQEKLVSGLSFCFSFFLL